MSDPLFAGLSSYDWLTNQDEKSFIVSLFDNLNLIKQLLSFELKNNKEWFSEEMRGSLLFLLSHFHLYTYWKDERSFVAALNRNKRKLNELNENFIPDGAAIANILSSATKQAMLQKHLMQGNKDSLPGNVSIDHVEPRTNWSHKFINKNMEKIFEETKRRVQIINDRIESGELKDINLEKEELYFEMAFEDKEDMLFSDDILPDDETEDSSYIGYWEILKVYVKKYNRKNKLERWPIYN